MFFASTTIVGSRLLLDTRRAWRDQNSRTTVSTANSPGAAKCPGGDLAGSDILGGTMQFAAGPGTTPTTTTIGNTTMGLDTIMNIGRVSGVGGVVTITQLGSPNDLELNLDAFNSPGSDRTRFEEKKEDLDLDLDDAASVEIMELKARGVDVELGRTMSQGSASSLTKVR